MVQGGPSRELSLFEASLDNAGRMLRPQVKQLHMFERYSECEQDDAVSVVVLFGIQGGFTRRLFYYKLESLYTALACLPGLMGGCLVGFFRLLAPSCVQKKADVFSSGGPAACFFRRLRPCRAVLLVRKPAVGRLQSVLSPRISLSIATNHDRDLLK